PLEQDVRGKRLRKRRGTVLQRKSRHDQGQQRRKECRAIEPRLDHLASVTTNGTYNLLGATFCGTPNTNVATARSHPPGRRRAVGTEAAGLSPPQGRLRGGSAARWGGGAGALPRSELRSGGARRDAAEAGR